MPLYTPDGGVTAPEWRDLDERLRKPDGMGWQGDPRLWLGVGVVQDPSGRQGRRLEVWRDNEDGTTAMVGHWLPSEQHRVIFDLTQMQTGQRGVEGVLDRIDRHNDAIEKANSEAFHDAMYEAMEHAIRLHLDRTGPRTTFYMGGAANRGGRA